MRFVALAKLCTLLAATQFANLPELFLEAVDKYEKEDNVLALVTHRQDAERMRQASFKPDTKDATVAPPSSYANGVSSSTNSSSTFLLLLQSLFFRSYITRSVATSSTVSCSIAICALDVYSCNVSISCVTLCPHSLLALL
jgi:hypothetical protein